MKSEDRTQLSDLEPRTTAQDGVRGGKLSLKSSSVGFDADGTSTSTLYNKIDMEYFGFDKIPTKYSAQR